MSEMSGLTKYHLGNLTMPPGIPDDTMVQKPAHYCGEDGMELWDVLEAWGVAPGLLIGSAIQYICRAGKKGDPLQDLLKARQCCLRAGLVTCVQIKHSILAPSDSAMTAREVAECFGLSINLTNALTRLAALNSSILGCSSAVAYLGASVEYLELEIHEVIAAQREGSSHVVFFTEKRDIRQAMQFTYPVTEELQEFCCGRVSEVEEAKIRGVTEARFHVLSRPGGITQDLNVFDWVLKWSDGSLSVCGDSVFRSDYSVSRGPDQGRAFV